MNELANRVARHLSGQVVIVRDRAPADRKFWGSFSKRSGFGLIDVDPSLKGQDWLKVLLHEIAHAKSDWGIIQVSEEDAPPRSKNVPRDSEIAQTFDRIAEPRAEAIAAKWLDWGRSRARSWRPQDVLEALLRYPVA